MYIYFLSKIKRKLLFKNGLVIFFQILICFTLLNFIRPLFLRLANKRHFTHFLLIYIYYNIYFLTKMKRMLLFKNGLVNLFQILICFTLLNFIRPLFLRLANKSHFTHFLLIYIYI